MLHTLYIIFGAMMYLYFGTPLDSDIEEELAPVCEIGENFVIGVCFFNYGPFLRHLNLIVSR